MLPDSDVVSSVKVTNASGALNPKFAVGTSV